MRKGDDLTTFIVPKVEKIRGLNLPEPLGPPRPVAGQLLYSVELGYNVMKQTECFVSLKMIIVLTENYTVLIINSE